MVCKQCHLPCCFCHYRKSMPLAVYPDFFESIWGIRPPGQLGDNFQFWQLVSSGACGYWWTWIMLCTHVKQYIMWFLSFTTKSDNLHLFYEVKVLALLAQQSNLAPNKHEGAGTCFAFVVLVVLAWTLLFLFPFCSNGKFHMTLHSLNAMSTMCIACCCSIQHTGEY